jgi:xanthine dehydrogenase accessory factor
VNEVLAQVEEWSAKGDRVAIATVIDTRKSAPLPPGSKMAISDKGDVVGAVSGAEPRLLHFGIADSEAWDVGLPCGGEIDVFVERYEL